MKPNRANVSTSGLLLLLLPIWLAQSGCDFYGGDATSTPLMLGSNVWPGYEPLYLARGLDYYGDTSIRLVELSSASEVMRALRNNTIQAAALTLDEVVLLRQDGLDIRVVLVCDISNGGDVILAKPDIKQLSDLRGRRVGVEKTALGAYVLTRALQKADLSNSDVNAVPVEVDEHERAYLDGRVDAVVTFEPVRSRLLSKGAVQLFDSTQIPNEIVDVIVVRADALEQYSSQLEILLQGWFKALKYLEEHPMEASERLSARLDLNPDDVLAAYQSLHLPGLQENIKMLSGESSEILVAASRLSAVMKEADLLEIEPPLENISSPEPLQGLDVQQLR